MNRYLVVAGIGIGTILMGTVAYTTYANFVPEDRTPREVACEAVQKVDFIKTNLAKSVESGTVSIGDMSGSVSRSVFNACDGMIGSVAYVANAYGTDLPLERFSFIHGSSLEGRALGIMSGSDLRKDNKGLERDMLRVPEIAGDRVEYYRNVISIENASLVLVKELKLRDRNFQEVENLDRNMGLFYVVYRTGLNTKNTSDDQIVEAIIRKYSSDHIAQVIMGPESTPYQSLQK